MPRLRRGAWLVALAVAALAGCGREGLVRDEVDGTLERVLAARAARAAPTGAPEARPDLPDVPLILCAPVPPPEEGGAADEAPAADVSPSEATPPRRVRPMVDRRFADIVRRDLADSPRALWDATKESFGKPANLAILGLAFGADRVVRHNLDEQVREDLRNDDTSLAETEDFGTVIGNPGLHFAIAGTWYLRAVSERDALQHERSKTLIEALAVNGLATMLLKVSMDDESPNDDEYGWPSGHTSSSMCFAAVMHQYYGWQAAVPLYALAAYSAASRVEDREHDVSDLVFGAALGLVVGHSVAAGQAPEIAGFQVIPYAGPDRSGILFAKQW